ncbi:MAG: LPS assembly lipoprotein LptE [Alphaproteobacteria bacterium]|nr:LPS assembly lipoprotein LptE [Alphaproteobacteria bacterium]
MQRRTMIFAGFAFAATTSLGGCGFRPLLSETEGDSVRSQLAAVRIKGLGGRLGQQLRTSLEDNLDPTSSAEPARYDLVIRLRNTNSALAIQLDNTITRYNLALNAGFELRRRDDQQVLYRSSVRRVASYNVRRAPFATLTAKKDAQRRAAQEVADDIRTLLALHFQRRTNAT